MVVLEESLYARFEDLVHIDTRNQVLGEIGLRALAARSRPGKLSRRQHNRDSSSGAHHRDQSELTP